MTIDPKIASSLYYVRQQIQEGFPEGQQDTLDALDTARKLLAFQLLSNDTLASIDELSLAASASIVSRLAGAPFVGGACQQQAFIQVAIIDAMRKLFDTAQAQGGNVTNINPEAV